MANRSKYAGLAQLAVGEHVDIPLEYETQRQSISVTACNLGKKYGMKLATNRWRSRCGDPEGRVRDAVRVTRIY